MQTGIELFLFFSLFVLFGLFNVAFVVRMLFPIEFPSHQEVICDPYLFSFIMKVYADYTSKNPDTHYNI